MKAKIVKLILYCLSFLSLPLNHKLGKLIGTLLFYSSGRSKRITEANIRWCFADKSRHWQQKLIRQSLQESSKSFTELGAFWFWPTSKLLPLIIEEKGQNYLLDALNNPKGAIIVAPHFGAWELAGVKLCQYKPMTILYSPPKITQLDSLITRVRGRYGVKLAPANTRGVMQLIKALKQGQTIGILPDQTPDKGNGILSFFYGKPCYTMTLLSKISQKTGASIVFTVLERLENSKGYRMHYLPPDPDIYSKNVQISANALNKTIEQCIAINPKQYIWNYKRFKKIDPSQQNIY